MLYIVGTIAVVIIIITIALTYSQMQIAKEQEQKLKILNDNARRLQTQFREEANKLAQDGLVSAQVKQKYASLGNNFFVFQPINDANVAHFKSITELFISFVKTIQHTQVGDELIHFIESGSKRIPYEARDFSSNFYITIAPKLLTDLTSAIAGIEVEEDAEEFIEEGAEEAIDEQSIQEEQRMKA